MIIFGTKIKRKKMGYAADYCPICRVPVGMSIVRVSRAGHIYWVSISPGKPIFYESTCTQCDAVYQKPLNTYQQFVDNPDLQHALYRKTTDGLEQYLQEREAIDSRLYSKTSSYEERMQSIAEVFGVLQYMADTRAEKSSDESVTAVLTVLWGGSIIGAAVGFAGHFSVNYAIGFVVLATLLSPVMLYRVVVQSAKTRKKMVQDYIVRGLLLLDPTQEELESVLAQFQRNSFARSVEPLEICDEIETMLDRDIRPS